MHMRVSMLEQHDLFLMISIAKIGSGLKRMHHSKQHVLLENGFLVKVGVCRGPLNLAFRTSLTCGSPACAQAKDA